MTYKKKLIEVALPLKVINTASVRENYIYRGNPSSLHKWWAQRPLAAARAVLFAQMVDDPSSHPDLFPTEQKQERERQRLFQIIEELVQWESTTDEEVLKRARDEIWQSWSNTCAHNADHPRAKELFDCHKLPGFYDPFAGGGTLPLEAQRLGFESCASDLNPVAVLINKAMIEFPPKFSNTPPVNPDVEKNRDLAGCEWKGGQGLAEDVRYYGRWMLEDAERRIGDCYPKVTVTTRMAEERSDLEKCVGEEFTVIAWLWARTVKSPNPAFSDVDVPLVSTFMLSTKAGKEVFIEPVVDDNKYHFTVKIGKPENVDEVKRGTKLARGANFKCLMSGSPIAGDYIKAEGKSGRMGSRLLAVVVQGAQGRLYLPSTAEMENIAHQAEPEWIPELLISGSTQYIGVRLYGMDQFSQLFTNRQLVALSTFTGMVQKVHRQVMRDAVNSGLREDELPIADGGSGALAYADAIAVYLAFAIDKHAMYGNSLVTWYAREDRPSMLFTQQVLPMVWDFVELNPFCSVGGSIEKSLKIVAGALEGLPENGRPSQVLQANATATASLTMAVISTDPPYYDNVPYADLSDFFYVWLRRALRPIYPDLFATLGVPKSEELVAFAYRHDEGKVGAEEFFLKGMTQAMHHLAERTHPEFPVTIYYAFKQTESRSAEGTTNTGWDTFLAALIDAGFAISGTWPMRTERTGRTRDSGSNALSSSVVMVCRQQPTNAPIASRREFVSGLKSELPQALAHLQAGNIAPVDLAQAAIGPGMAVYTRYAKVLDAEGEPLTVRAALALINQTLDETLAEQEGDFDADTRWALTWFEEQGFEEGSAGEAILLSTAKGTAFNALEQSGIIASGRGKVRILRPAELPIDWDPLTDTRLTVWEMVHHLIRALEAEGEGVAAALVAKLGGRAETARELCYRLYTICERNKRATEAISYNGLVQSWPEITRLARESPSAIAPGTKDLFDKE